MRVAAIELHYLPSIEYFCAITAFDQVVFERHERFVKQTYRNRCLILTSQGVNSLTVPIQHHTAHVDISSVCIDYSQKWQNNHWRTIESAYRKAPFYEHYADGLKAVIYQNEHYLYQLNLNLLSFCLRSIRSKLIISESVTYTPTLAPTTFDMRSQIDAKKPYSLRNIYRPAPYYQVFGNGFAANLSLIDLLFCAGPDAPKIIDASRVGV